MELRELIRERRKEKALTLGKLAKMAVTKPDAISDYENGDMLMEISALRRVVRVLEIDQLTWERKGYL